MCNKKSMKCVLGNMKYSWQHRERAMQRLMTRLMVFHPGGLHCWASLADPASASDLLNCIWMHYNLFNCISDGSHKSRAIHMRIWTLGGSTGPASPTLHPPQTYNLLNCISDALLSSQWPYGRYNTVVWFGHTSQAQYTWQYATLGGFTRSPPCIHLRVITILQGEPGGKESNKGSQLPPDLQFFLTLFKGGGVGIKPGVSGKGFLAPGNGKGNWKSHSRFTGKEREFENCYGKGREIWGL